MKTTTTKHLITHRYESLTAFAEYQMTHKGYDMTKRTKRENLAFSGVNTMREASARAIAGLPELGVQVLRASKALASTALRQVNRTDLISVNDVCGSYVDMGRYIEGTPECMIEYSFDTVPVQNPVVTIVSNVNASGGIDKADLERRGRLIVALIKAVETSGRSTELWIDSTNDARGRDDFHHRISVLVKPAASPIDMGAVMYSFTDPSMLRALCFNAMHAIPENLHGAFGVGNGYGCVPTGSIRVAESYGPGAVYLPAVRWGENERTAEATVTKVLGDLGIA